MHSRKARVRTKKYYKEIMSDNSSVASSRYQNRNAPGEL